MRRTTCVSLAVAAALGWSSTDPAPVAERSFPARIRGITLSTHLDGRDWAWDPIVPTMHELRELGANWIAVHPYAAIGNDGSVRFHEFDPRTPPAYIARPVREAHALGLKILIKPHLAYWGTRFGWRGEIDFAEEAQWRRFFEQYERWIVTLAAGPTRGGRLRRRHRARSTACPTSRNGAA